MFFYEKKLLKSLIIGIITCTIPIAFIPISSNAITEGTGSIRPRFNRQKRLFIRIVILSLIFIALFLSSLYIFSDKIQNKFPIDIDKNITDWFPHNNTEQPKPSSGVQLFGFGALTIPANTKEINISLGNFELYLTFSNIFTFLTL